MSMIGQLTFLALIITLIPSNGAVRRMVQKVTVN